MPLCWLHHWRYTKLYLLLLLLLLLLPLMVLPSLQLSRIKRCRFSLMGNVMLLLEVGVLLCTRYGAIAMAQ